MKLTDWMKKEAITTRPEFVKFAKQIGKLTDPCSEHTVYAWFYGYRKPQDKYKRAIMQISNNEVSAEDFID